MKNKQFRVLAPFEVKAVTTPPHNPDTCAADGEVIKIAGYANFSGMVEAGDVFIDLVGDVVVPSGIDVSVWKKNPQILLQHDRHNTIGRGINVTKKKDGLYIEAEIHAGACEEEDFYRIKSGLLCYFSIGFRTLGIEYRKIEDKQVCFITKSLLLEASVVGIPCNGESSFQIIKALPEDEGFYAGDLQDQIKKEVTDPDQGDNPMELSAEQIKALAVAIVDEQEARRAAAAAELAAKEAAELKLKEEVEARLATERLALEAKAAEEAARAEEEADRIKAEEEALIAEEIKALAEQISELTKSLGNE